MRFCIVALALAALVVSTDAQSAAEGGREGMMHGLARASANMSLGWLEVPRGIIYENAKIPVLGLGLGALKGAGLTIWRTTYGALDFLTLGLTGDRLYSDEMPEFVWDADWVPRREEVPSITAPPPREEEDTIK